MADNHTSDLSEFDFSAIEDDFEEDALEDWGFNISDFDFTDDIKADKSRVGLHNSEHTHPQNEI